MAFSETALFFDGQWCQYDALLKKNRAQQTVGASAEWWCGRSSAQRTSQVAAEGILVVALLSEQPERRRPLGSYGSADEDALEAQVIRPRVFIVHDLVLLGCLLVQTST